LCQIDTRHVIVYYVNNGRDIIMKAKEMTAD